MVRQRSAKPLFSGSNPLAASNKNKDLDQHPGPFFIPNTSLTQIVHGWTGDLCCRVALKYSAVHLNGQRLNTLTQLFYEFGQLCILFEQLHYLASLLSSQRLALFSGQSKGFSMLGVGIGMCLIAVCLSRLGKQDKRGSIGCLQTEREIKQDKRIDVELGKAKDVQSNPDGNYYGLSNKKYRGSKKTGECLSLQRKPIITKNSAEMKMRKVESEVMVWFACG